MAGMSLVPHIRVQTVPDCDCGEGVTWLEALGKDTLIEFVRVAATLLGDPG